MGIGLPDDQIGPQWVQFAALITQNDARRYAGCSHHHGKSRRIVLAKSFLRIEQETIDGVAAECRWLECVIELFVVKLGQHIVDECFVAAGRHTHLLRKPGGLRIGSGWQACVPGAEKWRHLRIDSILGVGSRVVSHALVYRLFLRELVLRPHEDFAPRPFEWNIQREHPLLPGRLHRYLVTNGISRDKQLVPRVTVHARFPACPCPTVKVVKNKSTPVPVSRFRHAAFEFDSERDSV